MLVFFYVIFFPVLIFIMLVFAIMIAFLTILGLGVEFSRWGKNSLGGVKFHHVGTSETDKCVGYKYWDLQFNFQFSFQPFFGGN